MFREWFTNGMGCAYVVFDTQILRTQSRSNFGLNAFEARIKPFEQFLIAQPEIFVAGIQESPQLYNVLAAKSTSGETKLVWLHQRRNG